MNLDLLSGTLEIKENPGLDTFDPRFADIMALVEAADYTGAGEQSELVLQEQIYDIRIISYFLYGEFIQSGLTSLDTILDRLINVLDENLEAIGPAKKREKGIANSLKWLFAQLLKKIEYEEKKNADIWQSWLNTSHETVEQASEKCQKFQKVLGRTLEDLSGPITETLNKLKNWLDQFFQMVYKEPQAEPEVVEETVEEVVEQPTQTVSAAAQQSASASVPGSFHMEQLSIKLMTFQMLLKQQKYRLAAIVGDNINQLLVSFNPNEHLTTLFSPYLQTYAKHANELAVSEDLKNTLEWQCLKELYQTDLEAFKNLKENIELQTPFTPPQPAMSPTMQAPIAAAPQVQDDWGDTSVTNEQNDANDDGWGSTEDNQQSNQDDGWGSNDDVW